MRVWAVLVNTFKETIRNRILLNILLFAVGLIFLSLVLGDWSLGHQEKVIKDFGLAAMSIFGLLIAIFIGIRLVVQEMEQRTIYAILSKPLHRWEFVLGKYLGLACTLGLNVLLMLLALWIVNGIGEGRIDLALLPAVVLIFIEILLIVAFSLLFSTLTSPTLAAFFTIAVYIVGHTTAFLREYVQVYPDRGFHWLFKIIYYVMPNLENLNLKMAAVEHLKISTSTFGFDLLYGLCYLTLIMILTMVIFEKKDIK